MLGAMYIAAGWLLLHHEGNVRRYYNAGAVLTGGDDVTINGQIYVCLGDIPAASWGDVRNLRERPHFVIPKKSTDTFVDLAAVYWDPNNNYGTSTSGGSNIFVGYAVCNTTYGTGSYGAYANGDTYMEIEAEYASTVTVNVVNQITASIADPGTGQAIPVTAGGTVKLVVADAAETNTLAVPTFLGQELVLNCCTRAGTGTRTVSVANKFDGTNNTIAFAAAGQSVHLRAVQNGGTTAASLKWTLIANCKTPDTGGAAATLSAV